MAVPNRPLRPDFANSKRVGRPASKEAWHGFYIATNSHEQENPPEAPDRRWLGPKSVSSAIIARELRSGFRLHKVLRYYLGAYILLTTLDAGLESQH